MIPPDPTQARGEISEHLRRLYIEASDYRHLIFSFPAVLLPGSSIIVGGTAGGANIMLPQRNWSLVELQVSGDALDAAAVLTTTVWAGGVVVAQDEVFQLQLIPGGAGFTGGRTRAIVNTGKENLLEGTDGWRIDIVASGGAAGWEHITVDVLYEDFVPYQRR